MEGAHITNSFRNYGRVVIAKCTELGLYAIGPNREQARNSLIVAIETFIKSSTKEEISQKIPNIEYETNDQLVDKLCTSLGNSN